MKHMKQCRRLSIFLALALLLLAACGPATAPAAPAEEPVEEAAPAEDAATAPDEPAEDEAAADDPPAEESGAEASQADEAESTDTESADAEGDTAESDAAAADESGLPSGAVTYVLVPEETTASYIADEEFFQDALPKYGIPNGTQDTVGSTSAIEGRFTLDWSNLGQQPLGENSFTVDLSTLQSNQRLRDSWIRENGPQFNTYPTATFVAHELQGAPESYTMGETVEFQLVGDLTIHDTTQPATFDVSATLDRDTITGIATTTALMSSFGIEPPNFANTLTVNDEFQIQVEFTARAQE